MRNEQWKNEKLKSRAALRACPFSPCVLRVLSARARVSAPVPNIE